jgi:COP9 signalosome complex subunit 4
MEIYLKIARLYLEDQNHVSAEAYINRAALLQSDTKNKELQIIYKVCMCHCQAVSRVAVFWSA